MTAPIEKTVNVPMRPKEAFKFFTEHLREWWPTEVHSLSSASGDLPQDVTVEPRLGGHIIETKSDGQSDRWATITKWEPGQAFGASWCVGRPKDQATDILVVFTPTDTGTRVDLTHSGFERLAEPTAMAQNYDIGWDLVFIQRFATYVRGKVMA